MNLDLAIRNCLNLHLSAKNESVVCFAISTSIRAVVAKLNNVVAATSKQRQGIGSTLLNCLKAELRQLGVQRIDTRVHLQNSEAWRFYKKHC